MKRIASKESSKGENEEDKTKSQKKSKTSASADEIPPAENLRNAIESGDIVRVGRQIRNGIINGTFNDAQLMEIARSVQPPFIPMSKFVEMIKNADMEKIKDIMIAQHFFNSIRT